MSGEDSIKKIDMHMHSIYSDGTDSLEALLQKVKCAQIDLFSLTDHDCITGCEKMQDILKDGDPVFVPGVEFSCKDKTGKYHILGYNYDMNHSSVRRLAELCHNLRIEKTENRLKYLQDTYNFSFSEAEQEELLSQNNPGKPHIAGMMVKKGYVQTISEGIEQYLSNYRGKERKISPQETIEAILEANGIPVLAHGLFGDGGQLLTQDEMKCRVEYLKSIGLLGIECFYSGFSPKQEKFMVSLCIEKGLFITAGSDYHGENKMVMLGDISVMDTNSAVPLLEHFVKKICNKVQTIRIL